MREMKFRGASGKAHTFVKMTKNAPWAQAAGVALFAARGPYGWRVVRLIRLRSRAHDVQPIWALADAERYGADSVFVLHEADANTANRILQDLEAGLDPVCSADTAPTTIAA